MGSRTGGQRGRAAGKHIRQVGAGLRQDLAFLCLRCKSLEGFEPRGDVARPGSGRVSLAAVRGVACRRAREKQGATAECRRGPSGPGPVRDGGDGGKRSNLGYIFKVEATWFVYRV